MHRQRHLARVRVIGASAVLVAAFAVTGASPAAATLVVQASVSGSHVVPGPGDEDAAGVASPLMQVDDEQPDNGRACVFYEITDMDPGTVAQIGLGGAGDAGTIVATIPVEDDAGSGAGCVDGVDPAVVAAFNDDPTAYFVQVVNDAYPEGAVRGQVAVGAVIAVSVHTFVCPGRIRSAADVLSAPDGTCTPAARTGDFGSPPPGFSWDPKPTEFDFQVSLESDDGTLTLAEADLDGGGTCGGRTCTPGRWYTWQGLAPGPMTLTQLTLPKGYKFGWATVGPVSEGQPVPTAVVDVAGRSITFDLTAFGSSDGISINLYDFRGH